MTAGALDDEVGTAHHVVATAGHVDHGKSSPIVRLTGIDPDRQVEPKADDGRPRLRVVPAPERT